MSYNYITQAAKLGVVEKMSHTKTEIKSVDFY